MLAVFNGPPLYQSLDVARSCDDEIPGAALYRTFGSPVLSEWKLLQYKARAVEVKGKNQTLLSSKRIALACANVQLLVSTNRHTTFFCLLTQRHPCRPLQHGKRRNKLDALY